MATPAALHEPALEPEERARLRQQVALFEMALQAPAADEQALNQAYARISGYNGLMPGLLLVVDHRLQIRHANEQAGVLLGMQCRALPGRPLAEVLPDCQQIMAELADRSDGNLRCETQFRHYDGAWLPVLLSLAVEQASDDQPQYVLVGIDLRERRQLEVQLRHAQKLEAMGSLAAGMAHEINTPLQFLGDNLDFVEEAARDLLALLADLGLWLRDGSDAALTVLRRRHARLDADFLVAQLPQALARSQDGVRRVTDIISSLRTFSHASEVAVPEPLDALIENAATLVAHELRPVADLVFDLADLPPLPCRRDHLVQVLINLLTNAAHAVAERFGDGGGRGLITISTALSADRQQIELVIGDNGCGVPEAIRHRIFDPFFTTKPVGRGTGQGLAISRAIIVDQHHGSLECESQAGAGSRFVIRLPLQGVAS